MNKWREKQATNPEILTFHAVMVCMGFIDYCLMAWFFIDYKFGQKF